MLYFAGKGEERFKESWRVEWGEVEFSEFPNKEQRVRLLSKVEGENCVVVQGMAEEPDRAWVRAMLLGNALKENGAKSVKLVVPFLSYALMNRHFEGEPISAKVVAQSLSLMFDEIEVWEVHEEGIADFFTVPIYNRPILLEMAEALKRSDQVSGFRFQVEVVVSPDKGSVVRARQVARELGVDLVLGKKERDLVSTQIKSLKFGSEVELKGKRAVIVDDMVNTGGTVVRTAEFLRKEGVSEVGLMVAHWLPVEGNWERVSRVVDWVKVSDSIKLKIKSEKLKIVEIKEAVYERK